MVPETLSLDSAREVTSLDPFSGGEHRNENE
jgi:hypothetical protein